ncbi:hypothetical protein [Deinococcus multiflagellatus]|uniref:HK97 gp10 family phage protein n=1 Tax=Deinococcus multiflagellatus TaxID=1656887 RepID=A0ABW1ZG58_9DEIO|nr:hypothetical protein [Deinococcus multiflagellatus]MBZ9712181.1 hypothetical protein [Deinococcus multiflagellatus]
MIVIRTDAKLPRTLQRLEGAPLEATRTAMNTARDFLREEARRNVSKGGSRGLNVRSGALHRSIRTYMRPTPHGAQLSLGSLFYGLVHNKGMTITAKAAPMLKYYIPGVGWRQSKSVTLPRKPWADDAAKALQERFPGMLRQALRQRLS